MSANHNLVVPRLKLNRDISDSIIRRLTASGGSFVRVRALFLWSDKNDAAIMREAARGFSVKSKAGRFWLAFYGLPAGVVAATDILADEAALRELGEA